MGGVTRADEFLLIEVLQTLVLGQLLLLLLLLVAAAVAVAAAAAAILFVVIVIVEHVAIIPVLIIPNDIQLELVNTSNSTCHGHVLNKLNSLLRPGTPPNREEDHG